MLNAVIKIFKTTIFLFSLCFLSACYYLYPHDTPLPDSYFKNDQPTQNYQVPKQQYQQTYQQPNPAPNQYYIPANQVNYQQQYGYQPMHAPQPIYYPYHYYQGGSSVYNNPYIIPQPILQQAPQIQDQDQYYKIPSKTQYLEDTNR